MRNVCRSAGLSVAALLVAAGCRETELADNNGLRAAWFGPGVRAQDARIPARGTTAFAGRGVGVAKSIGGAGGRGEPRSADSQPATGADVVIPTRIVPTARPGSSVRPGDVHGTPGWTESHLEQAAARGGIGAVRTEGRGWMQPSDGHRLPTVADYLTPSTASRARLLLATHREPAAPLPSVAELAAAPAPDSAKPVAPAVADGSARTGSPVEGADVEPASVGWGRGPLPSFTATLRRDLLGAPRELWEDTKAVILNPFSMGILAAGAGGAIATYNTVDDRVTRYYSDRPGGNPHIPPKGLRTVGDVLGAPQYHIAAAGAMYLVSIPAQDEKFYDFSRTLILSLGLTNAATLALKVSVNQPRPNGNSLGFPSGHAASTFCFASVVHDYYGPFAAAPIYGVGVLTSWQRLWDREHRFTDVWFGALLGTVIGHSVGIRHKKQFLDFEVTPVVEPGVNARDGNTAWLMFGRNF